MLGRITDRVVSYSPVPVWVVKRFTDTGGYFSGPSEDSWLEDQFDDTPATGPGADRQIPAE